MSDNSMFWVGMLFVFLGATIAFGLVGFGVVTAMLGLVSIVFSFVPDKKP